MKKLINMLLLVLISPCSFAEDTEISVFSGYRMGGELTSASSGNTAEFDDSSSLGFIFATDYGPEHVMEFLYSKQNTALREIGAYPFTGNTLFNVDIEYFQLGGSQIWSDKKIDKFFGAGLGIIQLDPDDAAFTSKSRFAMSFGGGMVYKITKNIGLRLELRAYFSTFSSSSTFCDEGNDCIIVGNGFMQQLDANAGIRFRF